MHPELAALVEKLGLEPMNALDVTKGNNTSAMLQQMAATAFTGRALGEAADVMEQMIRDKSRIVLTLSGAMTMAGLSQLLITMIEKRWVHCVVSTGALVGHGMVEGLGMTHFKARPDISDEDYYGHRLNRVYDTLEPEQNLNDLEKLVRPRLEQLAEKQNGEPVGTIELLSYFGEHLPGHGILQAAFANNVPVIIPAFTDSELGLDFSVYHTFSAREDKPRLIYDAFRDLEAFRLFCLDAINKQEKLGIFTVGGGVPRNWAQQVGPYVDVRNYRLGTDDPAVRFTYGLRLCPDPVHYGHLSGCTYSEGVSWGKFLSRAEGGRHAEVLLDATVAWPLLVRAMLDRGL